MQPKKHKANWALRIAAVLLSFSLISSYMLSGMMAKYRQSTSGSDSARAAKMSVAISHGNGSGSTVTLEGVNDALNYGNDSVAYTFYVTVTSEVKCSLDIKVTSSVALPTGVSVGIEGYAGKNWNGNGSATTGTLTGIEIFKAGSSGTVRTYVLRVTDTRSNNSLTPTLTIVAVLNQLDT